LFLTKDGGFGIPDHRDIKSPRLRLHGVRIIQQRLFSELFTTSDPQSAKAYIIHTFSVDIFILFIRSAKSATGESCTFPRRTRISHHLSTHDQISTARQLYGSNVLWNSSSEIISAFRLIWLTILPERKIRGGLGLSSHTIHGSLPRLRTPI
jgi:hypothetical protein